MLQSINIASLSSDQRKLVDHYLSYDSQPGVLVSVYAGAESWDLRPLLLQDGILSILRVRPLNESVIPVADYLTNLYDRLSLFPQSVGLVSRGRTDDFFWVRRRFFRAVLEEKLAEKDFDDRREILEQLVSQVRAYHEASIFHGNLTVQNVGIRGEEPALIDFGFRLAADALRDATSIPETKQTSLLDVLGLANLCSSLLESDLKPQEKEFLQSLEGSSGSQLTLTRLADVFSMKSIGRSQPLLAGVTTPRHIIVTSAESLKSGRLIDTSVGMLSSQSGRVSSSDSVLRVENAAPSVSDVETEDSHSEGQKNSRDRLVDAEILARIREDHKVVGSQETKRNTLTPPSSQEETFRDDSDRRPTGDFQQNVSKVSSTAKRETEQVRQDTTEFPRSLIGIVLALLLVLVFKQIGIFDQSPARGGVDSATYATYWSSNRRAFMSRVASDALNGNPRAIETVVSDILAGSKPPFVSAGLIRIAFNPLWANELRRFDKRVVMQLALAELLSDTNPLGDIERAHPAVLFAISASLSIDQNPEWLQRVNLKKLFALSGPVGKSFRFLGLLGVEVLGDLSARSLSHILVGDDQIDILDKYILRNDSLPNAVGKLKILLPLFPTVETLPDRLWNFFRNEGGLLVGLARWFAEGGFVNWDTVPAELKLSIMGAEIPFERLTFDQVADLVQYPIQSVRQAASESLESEDSSLLGTARVLEASFGTLTRAQSISLLAALHLKSDARFTFVSRWFETNPNPGVVVQILAARKSQAGLDAFNIEAVRYLKERKWSASHEILMALAEHQEVMARALVYAKLDPKIPSQRKLLEMRAKIEENKTIRDQLQKKLADVSAGGE